MHAAAQVNVLPHPDGKTAVSLTEAVAGTYTLDMETLATLGPVRFRDGVKGPLTTAHPSVRPDGSLVNLTSDVSCAAAPLPGRCSAHCRRWHCTGRFI